ncbi:hypothetical protein K7395_24880 [Streptomyces filamentosus]|uniref:Uncharacterized protein n=3 Tax=Streptomyces TaxID=1883 RepID=A0ABY4UZP4_STRFL|nr:MULTISPECIES: hypothetical protein [Streptomyces]EFE74542.1 conserved hypothetical protein [Streptomyces filamentosus NRRL 15998]EWS91642.1 hypothetical protein SSIG_02088 [Streptomyces filamentosus NRRL 11379]MYR78672.1 hypothetical protein [Streptomyces sp. SID5466]USC49725.1 hypothetical protein K7395_24880 [Streptomyces filamentosus]
MPKLPKDQDVEVKLDSGAVGLHAAIPEELRRALFERPGSSIFGVVQLRATSYTGHADGEDKDAVVKLRITLAEVALDDPQTKQVAEIMRAMMRRRKVEGTLDAESGLADRDVELAVADALASMPTEDDYEAHQMRERQRLDRGRVEQRG